MAKLRRLSWLEKNRHIFFLNIEDLRGLGGEVAPSQFWLTIQY